MYFRWSMVKEIFWLIQKEWQIEWRRKAGLSSILLYVVTTSFVLFLALNNPDKKVWNVLYWIIILFASVNALAGSFVREGLNRHLYYYSMHRPLSVVLAKAIFNTLLLGLLCTIAFFMMVLFTYNPVLNKGLFITTIILGATGFSMVFSFLSAVVQRVHNGAFLMVILGFPIIIALLVVLLRLSGVALGQVHTDDISGLVLTGIGLNAILLAAIILLFPFLWKD